MTLDRQADPGFRWQLRYGFSARSWLMGSEKQTPVCVCRIRPSSEDKHRAGVQSYRELEKSWEKGEVGERTDVCRRLRLSFDLVVMVDLVDTLGSEKKNLRKVLF
ncbi:hypothetical protein IRJ41_002125 [Triplophysa rosa]|uniref:Uncharacterized protein n=1 Tax=Triplophysa rosa TaxID=992332 RepID=A0A9W7TT96_TRIRA|nr:hypothetical protein IRJ41_002125 [Triplophysa rosa]